ncbi:MAG: N-acyl homoserine lactonase family protein [Pseudomonadota bacterium]
MSAPPDYKIYALRYAVIRDRPAHHNFISPDAHDGPMPLDYFVWAIVGDDRTIVVDTGFGEKEAESRGRELLRTPRAALASIGIDSHTIEDVIITHLHYDHAGTTEDFPKASFHLQDLEMQFATGRHMRYGVMRYAFSVEDVVQFVRHVYDQRVQFHDGDAEIAPGVSVHFIGGHTMGLQCVRVHTARGWVVLASDASHYYDNMRKQSPFPIVFDVSQMLEGYDILRRWADSEDHIVPGHDPLVLQYYPAASPDQVGEVVRLDLPPIANE